MEIAPVDLAGTYILSLGADVACTGIPPTARARTYTATVVRHQTVPWVFDVSIADPSVLHGYEWEGMNMSVAGNYVFMSVGDAHGSVGLVEQVAPDAYLGFDGGSGSSVVAGFSTVSMPFDGVIEYCQQPTGSASPTSSGKYQMRAYAAECGCALYLEATHLQLVTTLTPNSRCGMAPQPTAASHVGSPPNQRTASSERDSRASSADTY